jgi:enoyl-CoA hydratase/carnithine racemase
MSVRPTEPIEVSVARDVAEASLLRGMLLESGIEAMVVNDNLVGIAGEVPPQLATPRIWVRSADAERARQLIEEYRAVPAGTTPSASGLAGEDVKPERRSFAEPFCYFCGERVSIGQSPCPVCGQLLEWDADELARRVEVPESPDQSAPVLFRNFDQVGLITLNNPEKRNPLSRAVLAELLRHLQAIERDNQIRVVIIRSTGPAFSAGHDLRELVAGSEQDFASLFRLCSEVMEAIRKLSKPVIAQVQGIATAAGCQLAAACDLVVASDGAAFATPGVKIGLFCSTPAVAVSRAVPVKKALEMLLTGDAISAADAERVGLVNRVVPASELHGETMRLARRIVEACPDILGLGKRTFYEQLQLGHAAAYDLTTRVMVQNALLPEAQEGMRAFLERRPPVWNK